MQTWSAFSGDIQDVRKWTSYVKAFESHFVRRCHFQSRDKDGGYTTGSAIAENPMLHGYLMALSFIEAELWATEVYIAGIGIFYLFLLLWPWPRPGDLHITLILQFEDELITFSKPRGQRSRSHSDADGNLVNSIDPALTPWPWNCNQFVPEV